MNTGKIGGLFPIIALLLCISFVACNKPDPFDTVSQRGRTNIHILNAYPNSSHIDIEFESFDVAKPVVQRLRFGDAWPKNGYSALLITEDTEESLGGDSLYLSVFDGSSGDTLMYRRFLNLSVDNKYTMVVTGDSAGNAQVATALDQAPPVADSVANLRFMNVTDQVKSVSLVAANAGFRIRNLNYLNLSSFREAPVGNWTFYFVNDFTGEKLDSIQSLEIRHSDVYSFYIYGDGNRAIGTYELLD